MKIIKFPFILIILFNYCSGKEEEIKHFPSQPSFVDVDILTNNKNKNNFIKLNNLFKNEGKLLEIIKNNNLTKKHKINKRREGLAHVGEERSVFNRLQTALRLDALENNSTLNKTNEEEKNKSEEEIEKSSSSPLILAGRQFWVNALKTLLLEFRKIHPELVNPNKFKRRAAAVKTITNFNKNDDLTF